MLFRSVSDSEHKHKSGSFKLPSLPKLRKPHFPKHHGQAEINVEAEHSLEDNEDGDVSDSEHKHKSGSLGFGASLKAKAMDSLKRSGLHSPSKSKDSDSGTEYFLAPVDVDASVDASASGAGTQGDSEITGSFKLPSLPKLRKPHFPKPHGQAEINVEAEHSLDRKSVV